MYDRKIHSLSISTSVEFVCLLWIINSIQCIKPSISMGCAFMDSNNIEFYICNEHMLTFSCHSPIMQYNMHMTIHKDY